MTNIVKKPVQVQVNFRLPLEVKEKIEESANLNGQSITVEIIERLKNSFEYENLLMENLELQGQLVDSESEKLDLLLEYQEKLFELQNQILNALDNK